MASGLATVLTFPNFPSDEFENSALILFLIVLQATTEWIMNMVHLSGYSVYVYIYICITLDSTLQ